MGRLTKLSFIDASQNEIEQIAPEIEQCANLNDLDLSHNNLQTLPESFGKKMICLAHITLILCLHILLTVFGSSAKCCMCMIHYNFGMLNLYPDPLEVLNTFWLALKFSWLG